MNEQRSPRSGTIPVPLMPQREIPWFKVSVAFNVILALGLLVSLFSRPAGSQDSKAAIEALAGKDPQEALTQGAAESEKADQASEDWHRYLGEASLKAGKRDQARVHYLWLVKNYPKEAAYRKGLSTASSKKPASGKKSPKKKK